MNYYIGLCCLGAWLDSFPSSYDLVPLPLICLTVISLRFSDQEVHSVKILHSETSAIRCAPLCSFWVSISGVTPRLPIHRRQWCLRTLLCLTVVHVPCKWTVYCVHGPWTFSLASFSHHSYPFSWTLGLIALSFVVPFSPKCRDALLFPTMFPEEVCHPTSCACLIIPSSVSNTFSYGVVSFIPVRVYNLFFVGSCLLLWPFFLTGYLRLSHIGSPFLCRIDFGGSRIALHRSSGFRFSTYRCTRGFALSVS